MKDESEQALYDLRERVKELACLYEAARLIRNQDSLPALFRGIVALIPSGLLYPETGCARLLYNGDEYVSDNFLETEWDLTTPILVGGVRRGSLTVSYREERPESDVGPFLNEELNLLESLANLLGDAIDRHLSQTRIEESERKYRTLVENLPQKVFFKDKDSRFIACNERLARDLHLKPEEIVGKQGYEWWPKALVDRYIADDRRVMETGETEEIDETYVRNGEERIVHTVKTPVKDDNGSVVGLLGIFWDITEPKRTEEALHLSQRELRIRNRIKDIFLTTPDEEMYAEVLEVVLEALDSKYGVFGYLDERGDLVVPTMTRHVWDECQVPEKTIVFPHERWGNSIWPRCLRERRILHSNEESQLTPKGHVPITRNVSVPLVHKGEAIGLLQVANKKTDYDEGDLELLKTIQETVAPILHARLHREREENYRKRAEEMLAKHAKDLERSNQELEQFAYVASHDLQEPLRMVSSYTQLLERRYKDKLDDDANDFIGFAVDGANRMQKSINDLLSYSRVTTRGNPFELTDSHEALGRAISNLSYTIQKTGAIVTNDDLPAVFGDSNQLTQIFQNLLGNAVKYQTGERPHIHVSAQEMLEEWLFSVRDNGIGIAPEYYEKIFVIFQRLHSKQEYSGTGIGLAVCKRIVERHGGRIWVESSLGLGSTFYFTIPKEQGVASDDTRHVWQTD